MEMILHARVPPVHYIIGMIMTQPGLDKKSWSIAFHSWKLIQAELDYNIHDKELLAIVTVLC